MHKISDNKILAENNTEIDLLEWKDIARQGFKSNGTSRTQLEFSRTKLAVKDVLKNMIIQLGICRLHVGQSQWINHVRRLDLIMSNPDVSRVICTDFGATLDLHACETDNSSVDNHAVICIFFVLTD